MSVEDADGVTPTSGSGEYFVGSVDASEFATFELGATVDSGVSSIPVEITYIVDGERVTTTQQVPLDSAGGAAAASGSQQADASSGAPSGAPGQSGSGLPVVPIAIGVVVLVAAGGGLYYLWNRE
ncbi:hypothetical protein [Halarchaeum grantii]|uniref:hypothetical protein n=1 Tax=Halarchaeum grantii TaxID=1193105 RepID=UPI001669FFE6|nr:hypothetical protein [Halarchaeum grantii]